MEIVKKKSALSVTCSPVESLEKGLEITDQLFEVLDKQNGIGLAANQIGIGKRACVITVPENEEGGDVVFWAHRFINPTIVEKKKPFIFTREGCLSFPDELIETIRFREIFIKDDLRPDGVLFEGLAAVIVYHEYDHLDGITMHDRSPNKVKSNDDCPCDSGDKFKKCCQPKIKEEKSRI